MKDLKVTIKAESGQISYEVSKTIKGATSFGKRIANDAFYGEEFEVVIEVV